MISPTPDPIVERIHSVLDQQTGAGHHLTDPDQLDVVMRRGRWARRRRVAERVAVSGLGIALVAGGLVAADRADGGEQAVDAVVDPDGDTTASDPVELGGASATSLPPLPVEHRAHLLVASQEPAEGEIDGISYETVPDSIRVVPDLRGGVVRVHGSPIDEPGERDLSDVPPRLLEHIDAEGDVTVLYEKPVFEGEVTHNIGLYDVVELEGAPTAIWSSTDLDTGGTVTGTGEVIYTDLTTGTSTTVVLDEIDFETNWRYISWVSVSPTGDPIVTYSVGQGSCYQVVDYSPGAESSDECSPDDTDDGMPPVSETAVDLSPDGDRVTVVGHHVTVVDGQAVDHGGLVTIEPVDGDPYSVSIPELSAPVVDVDAGLVVIGAGLAPADMVGETIQVIDLDSGELIDLGIVGAPSIQPVASD
jgi:hypothetical protein